MYFFYLHTWKLVLVLYLVGCMQIELLATISVLQRWCHLHRLNACSSACSSTHSVPPQNTHTHTAIYNSMKDCKPFHAFPFFFFLAVVISDVAMVTWLFLYLHSTRFAFKKRPQHAVQKNNSLFRSCPRIILSWGDDCSVANFYNICLVGCNVKSERLASTKANKQLFPWMSVGHGEGRKQWFTHLGTQVPLFSSKNVPASRWWDKAVVKASRCSIMVIKALVWVVWIAEEWWALKSIAFAQRGAGVHH